jgi:hypothetical protein
MPGPRVAAGLFLLLAFILTTTDAFANDDGTGRPPNGRLLYAWGRDNSNQLSQGDFNTDISTLIDRSKSKRCRLLPCQSSPRPPRTGRHAVSSPDGHSNGPRGEQAGLRSPQARFCREGARFCLCGRQRQHILVGAVRVGAVRARGKRQPAFRPRVDQADKTSVALCRT